MNMNIKIISHVFVALNIILSNDMQSRQVHM